MLQGWTAAFDEDAEKNGYYFPKISQESVDRLKKEIESLPAVEGSIIHEFKNEVLPYLLLAPLEKHTHYSNFKLHTILSAYMALRDQAIQNLDKSKEGWEKERSTLYSPYTRPQEFKGNDQEYIDYLSTLPLFAQKFSTSEVLGREIDDRLEGCTKRYNGAAQEIGGVNPCLLRYFINKHILFGTEQSEEAAVLWRALKASGAIETKIPDNLFAWFYDPVVAVGQALKELNPKVLTLGCGSSIFNVDKNDELTSFGEQLGGAVFSCVTCGDAHVGELSMAHADPVNQIVTRAYDETAHATIRADMLDQGFWDAFADKRFEVIKEHSAMLLSWDESTRNKLFKNMDRFLQPNGTLEILGWGESLSPEILGWFQEKRYEVLPSKKAGQSTKFLLKKPA